MVNLFSLPAHHLWLCPPSHPGPSPRSARTPPGGTPPRNEAHRALPPVMWTRSRLGRPRSPMTPAGKHTCSRPPGRTDPPWGGAHVPAGVMHLVVPRHGCTVRRVAGGLVSCLVWFRGSAPGVWGPLPCSQGRRGGGTLLPPILPRFKVGSCPVGHPRGSATVPQQAGRRVGAQCPPGGPQNLLLGRPPGGNPRKMFNVRFRKRKHTLQGVMDVAAKD